MKIVHLCLGNYFNDNYSYQENLITKYHKKLGYDVSVIAGMDVFDSDGKITYLTETTSYINENEIPVTRLLLKKNNKTNRKLKVYVGLYEELERQKPDILFIHNCQFLSIKDVIKYLKENSTVKVYVDNHADFLNSASNWVSLNILHKIIWKLCAKAIEPYATKFYGVLPARVDFLTDVYGLPKEKTELLVMGADDEKVNEAYQSNARNEIREKYNIAADDFVVITGGKIDSNKPEVLNLIKAVSEINDSKIKLMVFGTPTVELKDEFDKLVESERIVYIGWIRSDTVYQYYAAADIAFFPGKHSVLWEEAVGSGLPCVFRRMKGFEHIDLGGNCRFIDNLDCNSLKEEILFLRDNPQIVEEMKKVSMDKGLKTFSYMEIAKRSIEVEG